MVDTKLGKRNGKGRHICSMYLATSHGSRKELHVLSIWTTAMVDLESLFFQQPQTAISTRQPTREADLFLTISRSRGNGITHPQRTHPHCRATHPSASPELGQHTHPVVPLSQWTGPRHWVASTTCILPTGRDFLRRLQQLDPAHSYVSTCSTGKGIHTLLPVARETRLFQQVYRWSRHMPSCLPWEL